MSSLLFSSEIFWSIFKLNEYIFLNPNFLKQRQYFDSILKRMIEFQNCLGIRPDDSQNGCLHNAHWERSQAVFAKFYLGMSGRMLVTPK